MLLVIKLEYVYVRSEGVLRDKICEHHAGVQSVTEHFDALTIYCEDVTFFHFLTGHIHPCSPLWLGALSMILPISYNSKPYGDHQQKHPNPIIKYFTDSDD